MREFKEDFEELGYTFQSPDVLEDVYTFYQFYTNEANKGVAAILLEGDPGSGKTFLSEIFSQYLGPGTYYLYTQCVEETNNDTLIATYNVPAIVKGDADKSIAEGILTKSINFANSGNKVVMAIDELDKARPALDSYFLDFLQSGKIQTMDNEILSLTKEGRENFFAIFAKNNERNLIDAFLRRVTVIELPPMPPVLVYKTLVRKFEHAPHDSKFLRFTCKVYEAIYNEQMNSEDQFLSRLPSVQEITQAITSDFVLYDNGVSSTRRIKKLVRNLGKERETREAVTEILVNKFKYKQQDSNYTETLDLDMTDPEDYMSTKDADSLVEQYIQKKDNGEYVFEEDELQDPMKDIASILDNMKDDQALIFLDKNNRERIVELGTITHPDPRALDILFNKIRFKGNPNSRFGFLNFEDENFVGLMKYRNTLVLIANKEYVSPRLLMQGLSTIIAIIFDYKQNSINTTYFSEYSAENFKLTGLNAKILSNIPKFVLNKMTSQGGVHIFQAPNLKISHDSSLNIGYFRYMQRHKAEPIYSVIQNICRFNPELALPVSFINAKKFSSDDRDLVRKYSEFEIWRRDWERLKIDGWEVTVDDFPTMDLSFTTIEKSNDYWDRTPKIYEEKDTFVFDWGLDKDSENKKLHVYPKYTLKGDYMLYTSDRDFENNSAIQQLTPFQREIAEMARNIYGNFVPVFSADRNPDYFSSTTMSDTGKILDGNSRIGFLGVSQDITIEKEFVRYYDSISQPASIITPEKVLTRRTHGQ